MIVHFLQQSTIADRADVVDKNVVWPKIIIIKW
jgi:hypothetical protein